MICHCIIVLTCCGLEGNPARPVNKQSPNLLMGPKIFSSDMAIAVLYFFFLPLLHSILLIHRIIEGVFLLFVLPAMFSIWLDLALLINFGPFSQHGSTFDPSYYETQEILTFHGSKFLPQQYWIVHEEKKGTLRTKFLILKMLIKYPPTYVFFFLIKYL